MKISLRWLHDFLPYQIDAPTLSHILTSIGLEVESIEHYINIESDLSKCVVARVVRIDKHPQADKLKIVYLDAGVPMQVVCGAPNIAEGQRVIVAKEGARLRTCVGEEIHIKKAHIRGVESEGMICAEAELGIGTDSTGIMVLDTQHIEGTLASALYDIYEDEILDISITPNRTDVMSHWGVARDVLAYINYHEKKSEQLSTPAFVQIIPAGRSPVKVSIDDSELCARYTGICVRGMRVAKSPAWLQHRLGAIGVRAINNIVDLTNYILYAYGIPVHAYDVDKIAGSRIRVGRYKKKVDMIFLDGKKRTIRPQDIVIMDGEDKPLCLAGVMGGASSAISDTTTGVFFEVAHFNAHFIRATSLAHELRTEAALRFEKGTDASHCLDVLKNLLMLLPEVMDGTEVEGNFVDVSISNMERKRIILPYGFIADLVGKEYPREDVRKILTGLAFEIANETKDMIEVLVPFYKLDIDNPYDIVEEIVRIDGLDRIPVAARHEQDVFQAQLHTQRVWRERSLDFLATQGFYEILSNPIMDKAVMPACDACVELTNPLSAKHNTMRAHTFLAALPSIAFNFNRQQHYVRFAEILKSYQQVDNQFIEQEKLCLWVAGSRDARASWRKKTAVDDSDFYFLKGMIATLCKQWGIADYTFQKTDDTQSYLAHTHNYFIGEDVFARLGYISASQLAVWDIATPVLYGEIMLDAADKHRTQHRHISLREPSKFPSVSRDIAIVLDADTPFENLRHALSNLHLRDLHDYTLFDVFYDARLGENKKSLALNFIFSRTDSTLTDLEIDGYMRAIISCLQENCGAQLRA